MVGARAGLFRIKTARCKPDRYMCLFICGMGFYEVGERRSVSQKKDITTEAMPME